LGGAGGEITPHRGSGAVPPRKKKLPREMCHFFASILVSIVGQFFGTWFFFNGFLFLVKELWLLTNPSHWVRVFYAIGSYMYIVL
jgi:hypothetical protein